MKKIAFILAAIAAFALVSCQKEPIKVETISESDVWEIEIEGETKADLTKTLTLFTNPNGNIRATLKKNGSTYHDSDVKWSWTGGGVKASKMPDGNHSGVSDCGLTAQNSGNETVYVTASVTSAPGANIPTKSVNVQVDYPTGIIEVTESSLPGARGYGVRLTAKLVFDSGLQGFDYNGEDICIDFNARCLLENLVDQVDCPGKPNSSWQGSYGQDTWYWQHPCENTTSIILNSTNTESYCDLDWSQGVSDGWCNHWGAQPTGPHIAPNSQPDYTLRFFNLDSSPDHVSNYVFNNTENFKQYIQ